MWYNALYKVFRRPRYTLLAFLAGLGMFLGTVWLPNIRLIGIVWGMPNASLAEKIWLPITLVGSISTNFTALSASYTIVIAILFGMQVALITYYLRMVAPSLRASGAGTGLLGAFAGILGTGCAACGSLVLTAGLSLVGASSALAILPFGGSEFGILGVILLAYSLRVTARRIEQPAVCVAS